MNSDGHKRDGGSRAENSREGEHMITVEQLQRLVRLVDRSDVSEIEVKRAHDGLRLVLRKARTQELVAFETADTPVQEEAAGQPGDVRHTIVAPLVGIFHSWAKPKGGALVGVGDRVKVGQLVATIQSLNVLNEVESQVTGRVIEILVQDGHPVEYGQPLMVIDTTEGA